MDSRWRQKLVQWSEAPQDGKVLDCATGTGVLAFEFQKHLGPAAQITAVDFCEGMLTQARKANERANTATSSSKRSAVKDTASESSVSAKQDLNKNINFQLADVQELPFKDNVYDVCSIAYGLRNVEDPIKSLMEMARVTKNGGTVMILETGDKPMFLLYPFFYLYFRFFVPYIGGWLTGQKSAYEYLQKSSRCFPSRHLLLTLMKEMKCFSQCQYKVLFFGASFIYKARVSKKP